jgi:hypothetical protein
LIPQWPKPPWRIICKMDELFAAIAKNPFNKECVTPFTKQGAEIRSLTTSDTLWGATSRAVVPARLTTAWLMTEDPLMLIAGAGYKATEVRDKSFALQEEALNNLRGNRKLTKAKMGDALASLKPTEDQTKVIARILLALKHTQTVCFDEVGKTVWTMPEDLRAWSTSLRTIWVDARCEKMLDFNDTGRPIHLGQWLSERERDGWKIDWPVSEDGYEEMKEICARRGISVRAAGELVGQISTKKPKKDDYARVLGRVYAMEHLSQGV